MRSLNGTLVVLCVLLIVLLTVSPMFAPISAQSNAVDLSGQILDPQSAAVLGAKVTVTNLATRASRTVDTNDEGRYTFVGLPPGRYELAIEKSGFAKLVDPELILTIGQAAQFDGHLTIQSGTQVVTVTDSADLIETRRTAVSETVDTRLIENLPINGRNYVNFTLINSQVARDSAPSIGAAPTSGLNFGGQRARSNQVSVDGADAGDNSVNGIRSTVSQEAVQEFQLIISNYMPEFGRATGGVINIVTKGGSNEVHGDLFGFLRHKSLQARNAFSVQVDPATGALLGVKQAYTRAQYGATIGGPIRKDKTFYFLSYEGTRRQETGFTSIGANNFGLLTGSIPCLPFPITLSRDQFTTYTALCAIAPMQAAQGALITSASSNVALNADINKNADGSIVPISTTLGIPAGLGSKFFPPAFAGVLAPLPQPSFVGLNSLRGNFPVSEGTSLWSARLDQIWSPRNSSFLRVNISPSTVSGIQVNAQNQTFGTNAGSRTSLQQYRDFAVVAQHITSITSNLFNEARFQFARRGLLYGFSRLAGGSNVGVDILGIASFGREPFSTVNRIERRFQWTDNMTWVKGHHNLKWGADANLIQVRSPNNQVFELEFGGSYRFSPLSASSTGLATSLSEVQTYGLGIPGSFLQGIGNSGRSFDNPTFAGFIQDSWKLHPRLTLNYGVRYDVELSPQFVPKGNFNAAAEKQLNVIEGFPRDFNNIAPRVALAWDPWGDGKTVVRLGYGLFYDHPPLASAFLAATADGAQSAQLEFGPGKPTTAALTPFNSTSLLNAANFFQGTLNASPAFNLGFQANGNQQRFDPFFPNSFFTNQNFLAPGTSLPLTFLPYTFPVARSFQFGVAHQGNLTVERQLGRDYKVGVTYSYTHGVHLNRARNINAADPRLLVQNLANAVAAGLTVQGNSPFTVMVPVAAPNSCVNTTTGSVFVFAPGALGAGFAAPNCPGNPLTAPIIGTPAIFNFFRRSGPNPSFAALFPNGYGTATTPGSLVGTAAFAGFPTGFPNVPVPFSDVVQQESSGNSIYHGLTLTFSKRFSSHAQFLASYTWSHAIDDSTDLQSLLAPQDNTRPLLDRGNSTFDQRHRFVFSGVAESPYKWKDGGWKRVLADFVVAPIIEVSSGRPYNILSGTDFNLDFAPFTDRPSVLATGGVTSAFLPGVHLGLPDRCAILIAGINDPAGIAPGAGCTGNLARNRFYRPGFFTWDMRISRKFYFGERANFEVIADAFNLFNRNNTADVNQLCDVATGSCPAGQPTAALDPRQFQFGLKINF